MANYRYFAQCEDGAVQLENIYHNGGCDTSAATFWGTCPVCFDKHPATRKIEYKSNPSKHDCDARCTHATGKTMKCECQCGGVNHGRHA